jgi:5-methyltetrahydrofolate corrinoid/iron sulfur protein methyltransferase
MLVIGEKINVISKTIGEAMKERNPEPIVELAKAQVEAGANMLDLNIGPGTKDGPARMEWLIKTVQEVVDVPCSLDSLNPEAIEAGLKVHRGQALINSTSGEKERLDILLPLAREYNARIIGLTMTKGIPRDATERAAIAVDIMTAAMEAGVPLDNLYLDPLILPIKVAQEQAPEVLEAIKLFKQLNDPPLKTVVGLSNLSNGIFGETKSRIDRIFLAMLIALGLDGAIMDPLDQELMNSLKTVRVFRGDILYAQSYLER